MTFQPKGKFPCKTQKLCVMFVEVILLGISPYLSRTADNQYLRLQKYSVINRATHFHCSKNIATFLFLPMNCILSPYWSSINWFWNKLSNWSLNLKPKGLLSTRIEFKKIKHRRPHSNIFLITLFYHGVGQSNECLHYLVIRNYYAWMGMNGILYFHCIMKIIVDCTRIKPIA